MTDAAVLAKVSTGALIVAAAGRVSSGQLQAAVSTLETVETTIGGVILSMGPRGEPTPTATARAAR